MMLLNILAEGVVVPGADIKPEQAFYQAVAKCDYSAAFKWLEGGVDSSFQSPKTGNTALHELVLQLMHSSTLDRVLSILRLLTAIVGNEPCVETNYENNEGKTAVYMAVELAASESRPDRSTWHGLCAAKILFDYALADIDSGEWRTDKLVKRLSVEKRHVFYDFLEDFAEKHIAAIEAQVAESRKSGEFKRYSPHKLPGSQLLLPVCLLSRSAHMRYSLVGESLEDDRSDLHEGLYQELMQVRPPKLK